MASQPRNATGCLFFFGLFWLSLVGIFDCTMVPNLWKQAQTSHYLRAEATVLECRVIEEKGDDSTSYQPYFRYQYQVGNRILVNDKYRRGIKFSTGQRAADTEVNEHPVGSKLEVWYSPEDPTDSVVQKGLTGADLFIPMFMTPFNLIGLVFVLAPVLATRRGGPGGVPLVREGLGWRARLQYTHPAVSALMSLGACTFLAVFIVAFGSGMNPSLQVMQVTWSIVLLISLKVGYKTLLQNRQGANDLRVEPGRLEFSSGGQRIHCLSGDVREVAVRREEKKDSDGDITYTYEVDLHLHSGSRHPLKLWNDESQAQEFADWLRARLG